MGDDDCEGEPASKPDPQLEFRMRKYDKDREHEIALNNAVAGYEQAMLQLLLVLNGGAATGFIALIGTIWKEEPQPNPFCVGSAVIIWVAGLITTLAATVLAYQGQVSFAKSYLNRRRAEERRQLSVGAEQLMGLETRDKASTDFDRKATKQRGRGSFRMKRAKRVGLAALLLFVAGVVLAAWSMVPLLTAKPDSLRPGLSAWTQAQESAPAGKRQR